MKNQIQLVKATVLFTFPLEIEIEEGEDKKRILREEALLKLAPPFNGWKIEIKED